MGLKVRKIVKNNDFQEIFTNTVNNHTEYTSGQNATFIIQLGERSEPHIGVFNRDFA